MLLKISLVLPPTLRRGERGRPRVSCIAGQPDASANARGDRARRIDHAAARAIIFGIMLAMFLSALEQTIVAPALPAIGRSLGGIDELSWVVAAYLLAATAATPLFGKLSDIYGRRADHAFGDRDLRPRLGRLRAWRLRSGF